MKREMTKILIGLGFMGAFACVTSQADVVAAWDVTGVEVDEGTGLDSGTPVSPYTLSASTVSAGVSGQLTLSTGPSILPSEFLNTYGFRKSGDHQTTLAGAIANDDYFQFTITADPYTVLHLDSIELFGQTQTGGTGADDVAILSSVGDGFVDTAVLYSATGLSGGGTWDATVNLASPEFQNLTGTTTFRLYAYNSTAAKYTIIRNRGDLHNELIINGTTTAVPEPSTLGLLGAGVILLTWLRKRRN